MNKNQTQVIVLYQGTCRFCNWCREFVIKHASANKFEFVAIESERGGLLIKEKQLNITQEHPDSIAVIEEDLAPTYKWQACLEICRHSSWTLRLLRLPLLLIPNRLGEALYSWIGRHRGLLCKLVRCREYPSA